MQFSSLFLFLHQFNAGLLPLLCVHYACLFFFFQNIDLQQVPNYFLVNEILRHDRVNGRVLVSWVGYSEDANSWVDVNDFIADAE